MEIKTIKTKQFMFNESEAKIINASLKHSYHRITKHNKHIANEEKIEELINQFEFENSLE